MTAPYDIRSHIAAEIEALSGFVSGAALLHRFVLTPLSRYLREAHE